MHLWNRKTTPGPAYLEFAQFRYGQIQTDLVDCTLDTTNLGFVGKVFFWAGPSVLTKRTQISAHGSSAQVSQQVERFVQACARRSRSIKAGLAEPMLGKLVTKSSHTCLTDCPSVQSPSNIRMSCTSNFAQRLQHVQTRTKVVQLSQQHSLISRQELVPQLAVSLAHWFRVRRHDTWNKYV